MLNLQFKWSLELNNKEIEIISKMEKNFFNLNSYSREELLFFKNNSNYELVCLCNKKNIIAYAIIFTTIDEIEIYKIAVNYDYRNLGYGTFLLNEIKSKFKKSKIFIEVSSNNNAYFFYIKNGFKNYSKRENYYIDGSDAFLMVFNPIP